jgi:peptide/nickel transport system permease protein
MFMCFSPFGGVRDAKSRVGLTCRRSPLSPGSSQARGNGENIAASGERRERRVMIGFVIQRLLQAVLVMVAMSFIVFIGVYMIGNPIDVLLSPDADQKIRADVIARYGLDLPWYEQYFRFASRLVQGDFGRSFIFGMPVLDLVLSRLPATVELTLAATLGATLIGVPLGIYAGYRPTSTPARIIMAGSVLGFSVPTFWMGILLIYVFAVNLGWLPAGDRGPTRALFGVEWSFLTLEGWRHLALPALNLSLFKLAMMIRLSRAGTREVILTDIVRFARAAGIGERTILSRHVLKLIAIPIVTVFGLELGSTMAFAVVTETIFSWPGVGKLIIDSIFTLDRPVMVSYLVLVTFLFIAINLTVDLTYALLDPRIRKRGA